MSNLCGRPTRSEKPCQNPLYGEMYRACRTHETAEDIAYREGYEAGRAREAKLADSSREFWIAAGRREERAAVEEERGRAEEERNFRTATKSGEQIIVADGRYTYKWGGEPLKVGDRVLLPENWLSAVKRGHGPFPGSVTAIGSSYQGDLTSVVRKIGSLE